MAPAMFDQIMRSLRERVATLEQDALFDASPLPAFTPGAPSTALFPPTSNLSLLPQASFGTVPLGSTSQGTPDPFHAILATEMYGVTNPVPVNPAPASVANGGMRRVPTAVLMTPHVSFADASFTTTGSRGGIPQTPVLDASSVSPNLSLEAHGLHDRCYP